MGSTTGGRRPSPRRWNWASRRSPFIPSLSAAGAALIIGYLQLSSIPTPTGRLWRLESSVAILIYVLIILVALGPGVAKDIGAPLRIEAILVSLMVFLGINVAWALMFDEVPAAGHERA